MNYSMNVILIMERSVVYADSTKTLWIASIGPWIFVTIPETLLERYSDH